MRCRFRGELAQFFGANDTRTAVERRVIPQNPTLRDFVACAGLLGCRPFGALYNGITDL
ncbi:MAG: hypothetical protein J5644_04765 [Bacteroidales bacterium]|nr:hypothetical protein [Bacteroidales bacterium]